MVILECIYWYFLRNNYFHIREQFFFFFVVLPYFKYLIQKEKPEKNAVLHSFSYGFFKYGSSL